MMMATQTVYPQKGNNAAAPKGGKGPFSIPLTCKAGCSSSGRGSKTTGYSK